jgi:hypothetical protein
VYFTPDHLLRAAAAPLDLAGAVVTADALHAQREHAQFLVTQKNAHYILAVKNNQPGLYAQLKALPWRQVPAGFDARGKGHGRAEWRTLKITAVTAGIAFPHATQAIQIRRRRKPLNGDGSQRWRAETSYAVTSLAEGQWERRPEPPRRRPRRGRGAPGRRGARRATARQR